MGGQNFPGGINFLFALKMLKNILFSFKKVKKKPYYFCRPGWGVGGKCPS